MEVKQQKSVKPRMRRRRLRRYINWQGALKQKGVKQERYSRNKKRLKHMEVKQQKSVKTKMRRRRLRRDINWQGALKQKRVKQMCVKQGLKVSYSCILK